MATESSSALDVGRLQLDLNACLKQEVKLVYFDSCESTNSECMQMSEHASVVIAEHQTAGRGRRGNIWHSPQTQNIYCSIGMNKTIQAEYLGLVSLLVGVVIAETLDGLGFKNVSLKWPNDVWLEGKKLGGVLIETRVNASNDFFLVIGFGLNTRLDEAALTDIDQPAISLSQVTDCSFDRQHLLVDLIAEIFRSIADFELQTIDSVLKRFARFDRFQGKQVLVKTRSETIYGTYQGLETTGMLRLQTDTGQQIFSAADISLREMTDVAD